MVFPFQECPYVNAKKKADDSSGRFNTSPEVKTLVWIRAAGHCELCGTDLTHDFRIGTPMKTVT